MLTDQTPTTMEASWASPSRRLLLGYLLRQAGVGGRGSEVRLPAHVHHVTYRRLKPGTKQTVCVRAIYPRGVSQPLCATTRTPRGKVPRPILCPPFWH
ncbi:collagen alpha-1(XX) chain-like [Carcharodon carcharias]|uniref:collagen alpha-1(XX) chain-like n=1 Tax=Carcharodon carcharias TaxID=13397 RepID=UPI001B7F16A1|nr:collagen alpha-1(XX) chain-like [Carcharodon carcharias]